MISGRIATTRAASPVTTPATIAPSCRILVARRRTAPRSTCSTKRKFEDYQTETGKPLKDDIFHMPLPAGAAGQFSYHVPFTNVVMGYSKNRKAAMDFLGWIHTKEVYDPWYT